MPNRPHVPAESTLHGLQQFIKEKHRRVMTYFTLIFASLISFLAVGSDSSPKERPLLFISDNPKKKKKNLPAN